MSFEAYKEAYRSEYEAAYKGRLDSGEITQEQYDELVNNYVREEIAADLMMDVMGNEELANMFAQNSTKEDLNFIARFFRKFIDAIKKVFGGNKKNEQYVYDAEKLLGVFERAVKNYGNKKASDGEETRSALNQDYSDEINEWSKLGKPDGNTFILGSTGNVLQGLGAVENDIYMRGDKIKEILNKHSEMTLDEIKKIPQILENPTLILKSQFKGGNDKNNSRLVIFGTVKTSGGSPVLTVLDLRPVEDTFVVDDMQKLTSAYIKDTNPVDYIRDSLVVYADKKKAVKLLKSIGFQMPIELQLYTDGYVGSISYFKRSVKIDGKKFSEVFTEGIKRARGSTTETRFALSSPVEKTPELIAVHNVHSNKLPEALDLGGLPMPSIAVTKAGDAHDKFGDVSFVFGRDTIDPKSDKRNKLYGGDAYTPTKPEIAIKIRESAKDRFMDIYYDYQKKFGDDYIRPLYGYANYADEEISRVGGADEAADRLKRDTTLMQAYLQMQGKKPVEPVMIKTETRMNEADVIRSEFFIEQMGEDVINAISKPKGMGLSEHLQGYYEKHGSKLKEAYKKYLSEVLGFNSEEIDNVMANYKNADAVKFIVTARNFLRNDGVTVETKEDYSATQDKIKEAIKGTGYSEWIDSLFDDIIEKRGIRNNKDLFTPSGNRRSFEDLYYEYNLENIVKAMSHGDKKGISAFGGSIFGAATKNYKTVEEARTDSDRLKTISEDEYSEMRSEFFNRLHDISDRLANGKDSRDAEEMLIESVAKYTTPAGIKNYLARESKGFYNYTDAIGNEFLELVGDIANMPTEYFEAKPERAVAFSEVKYAVVPDDMDKGLLSKLKKVVSDVKTYIAGDSINRAEVLNSVPEVRFALSSKSASKSNQTISENFKKWFGDWQNSPETASKVVNADGTPKIMYHGSPEQFTIFDKKKAKSSGAYGRGFYFTDSDSHAKHYGNAYAVYLDVKNPLKQGESKVTESQIRKYLEAVAENEDYSIENYGTYDVSEIMKKIESRDAFAVIQDVNATAIGDMVEAAKLWNAVNGTSFDGIVAPTETVVFEPTQIKSATDNIGTFDKNNPDIRYAVSAPSAKENSVFSPEQRKKIIPMLTRLAGSQGIARLSKNEFVTDVMNILEKTLDTGIVSDKVYEDIARTIYEYAREDAGDASVAGTYIDIKKRLYKMGKIYVSEAVKNDIPDYNDFRKQFGTLLTTKEDASYLSVDEVFTDLKADYPDVFSEDLNLGDQLQKIAEVLETARKYEKDNGLVSVSELYTFDKVKNDYLEMADDIVEGISALSGIELVDETEVYETLRDKDESVSATELPDELYITKGMTDEQVDAVLEKVRATSSKNSPEYKFIKRLFEAERNVENAKKNLRSVEKLAKTKGFEADSKRVVDFTKALANEFGFGSDVAKTADVGRELKQVFDSASAYLKEGDDNSLNSLVASIGKTAEKIAGYSSGVSIESVFENRNLPKVNTKTVENVVKDKNKARHDFVAFSQKNFPKTVKNINSGKEIGISRTGIDKFLSGNFSKEKYASGYVIPKLIETAYKVGEADNLKGKSGIQGYEYFESKLLIDGNEYTAHIRIRNTDMGDKYYGHTLSATVEEIEIEPSARISDEKSSGQPVNASSSINNSISQSGEIVNTSSDEFIDKLATKSDRNSQLAAAHADEIVYVSKTDAVAPEKAENSHQWLDYNGWEFRTATLNIGRTKDGRNVLYDINKKPSGGHRCLYLNCVKTQNRVACTLSPMVMTVYHKKMMLSRVNLHFLQNLPSQFRLQRKTPYSARSRERKSFLCLQGLREVRVLQDSVRIR